MPRREQTLSRLAALFAVSNFGMMTYINDPVGRVEGWDSTPEGEINSLAGFLMESDDHEELFGGEARMWYNNIKELSFGEIRDKYHYNDWIGKVIDAAETKVPLQFKLLSDAALAERKDIGPLED